MSSDFVWNFVKKFFNVYVFVPFIIFFRIVHKVFDFIEILKWTSNVACSCLAGGREVEAGSHSAAQVGLELARSTGMTPKQKFYCLCLQCVLILIPNFYFSVFLFSLLKIFYFMIMVPEF